MATIIPDKIKSALILISQGKSIRAISRLTEISRNTIQKYSNIVQLRQLDINNEEDFSSIFQVESTDKINSGRLDIDRYLVIEDNFDVYEKELRKVGVTRMTLWEEYIEKNSNGYSYSHFCEHLSKIAKKNGAVLNFSHVPGEILQIDFAGKKISYFDPVLKKEIICDVFVCSFPYSKYMYVEALHSQKQADFIRALINALNYFGGVPLIIKCDNMKVAVIKSDRYEPKINEALSLFAEHYGTTVQPVRSGKPKDKSTVEKSVDLTYQRIYAPIRNEVFNSLEELNNAFLNQLEILHQRPFQKLDGCRQSLFDNDEKPNLKALPAIKYELQHTAECKVSPNYHIQLGEDRHFYSVPYTLIGETLKVIYTIDSVKIYNNLKLVVDHKRDFRKQCYTTVKEHMPYNHQAVVEQLGWRDEDFEQKAIKIGKATHAVIKKIIASKIISQQAYNSCLGILRLSKHYGPTRLEAACQRALKSPVVNYRLIENILKKNLDTTPPDSNNSIIPINSNVRGKENYK